MLFALLLFVGLQVAVGFWAARKIRTEDDFLVAGRRLGPLLTGASIFATWFGAESCIGAAGQAYAEGLTANTTEPFAYGVCLLLMGLFFAARLWRQRITTLADFFSSRFGATTERVAACLLLPSSLLWAAAQVRAFGHIVADNSDGLLTLTAATWLAAGIAVVYTVSGGLLADVYTDFLQGLLLLAGLAVLGIFVLAELHHAGPGPNASTLAAAIAEPTTTWNVVESWAIPICGSIVAQEALSRSLAARSAPIARNGAILGGIAYLVVGTIPLAIGLVGPRLAPNLQDAETVLPHLSRTLLPAWLNLLFAGALIAAILSTVDSCLLVVSAIVARNLVPRLAASEAATGRLTMARFVVVIAGAVAVVLACSGLDVKELVTEASGFGSAGVFVLAVVGCYSKWGGPRAAITCLVSGLLTWIACRYLLDEHVSHPYLASLAAASLGFVTGALFDGRRHTRAT